MVSNPLDLVGIFDAILASIYQTLFAALQPFALGLAAIMFTAWIVYTGVHLLSGRGRPPMEYLWKVIVFGFFFGLIGSGAFLLNIILPLATEAPYEMAATISGGETSLDVFTGYYVKVNETLAAMWTDYTWRQLGTLIGIMIIGWGSMVFLTGEILYLIIFSKLLIAALITLAPLFIVLSAFESTRNLGASYFRQLLNYMFIPLILGIIMFISAQVLDAVVDSYLTNEEGGLAMVIGLGVINFLLFKLIQQVPLISTGIAGGMILSGGTFVPLAAGAAGRLGLGAYSRFVPESAKAFLGSQSATLANLNRQINFKSNLRARASRTRSNLSATSIASELNNRGGV